MKLTYEDLISGDSIYVEGVGHLRSPYLWELKPTKGIGAWQYNLYLSVLTWDKESVLKYVTLTKGRSIAALQNDNLQAYDVATLMPASRELLREAMAFFMDENLAWNEQGRCFEAHSPTDDQIVGAISRDNFDEVRTMMLRMNYVGFGESAKPTKFTSKKAQELWEQAQKHLSESKVKTDKERKMELGNIISKLCAAGCGYTLLNIYNLTVFQLYDQFFQYGYLRAMNLNERAYSTHGGKEFKFEAWLDPILKL